MGHTLYYARSVPVRELPAIAELIGSQMRCGGAYAVDIGHGARCPCRHGTEPLDRCSCYAVELHVFVWRP